MGMRLCFKSPSTNAPEVGKVLVSLRIRLWTCEMSRAVSVRVVDAVRTKGDKDIFVQRRTCWHPFDHRQLWYWTEWCCVVFDAIDMPCLWWYGWKMVFVCSTALQNAWKMGVSWWKVVKCDRICSTLKGGCIYSKVMVGLKAGLMRSIESSIQSTQ